MRVNLALSTAPLDVASQTRSNGRILVVDDVADNRDILCRRFARHRFETVQAADGFEALHLLESSTFDLVLLDVMMPRMSGLEVLQHIRAKHAPNTLPVIMVTAKADPESLVEALDLGANDYVTKPVNFPIAMARAMSQIERRRTALALQDSNETLRRTIERLVSVNDQLQEEIDRRVRSDERSSYLADHDPLTGLPNRHACERRLPDCLRSARQAGKRLAVLSVDLDGFKNVNDALGHAVGDALLREVAGAVRAELDESDVLVRLGGDEFCIFHVSDAPQASTMRLAQSVIAAVGRCRLVDGHQIFVGASVGIAIAEDDLDDPAELLKRADLAMYRAKADGRGLCRLFRPEMGERARNRRTVELDLREALSRGEFELHYQPIIELQSNRIRGFEALLRWQRPSVGYMPPEEFIPLAEETGLIAPIGAWVLRRACEEATSWPADVRVAVNVSPVQFTDKNLLRTILSALASSGLAPERLELELTETALLQNSADTLQILRKCRELGIRLSMDDFGTGYSSLNYFRTFRFDKVKIDRSFVRGIADAEDGGAIVRAVIGLGKSFKMTTLAEGVETQEQLDFVRQEGCHEVQGFLFGKPQPAAAARALISRYEGQDPSTR